MRRQMFFITILILILSSNLVAQDVTLSPGRPAEAGMDETILKAGVNMFQEAVEKDALRNVVVLIARKGKIVLHEAIGWKDKEKGIRITYAENYFIPRLLAVTSTYPS